MYLEYNDQLNILGILMAQLKTNVANKVWEGYANWYFEVSVYPDWTAVSSTVVTSCLICCVIWSHKDAQILNTLLYIYTIFL